MFNNLEQTFRWYGPNDAVTLAAIRQTGATGIVNALHHIPTGEVWSLEEITKRKAIIEDASFGWSVVESVNVHDSIKTADKNRERYAENYIKTLKNLATCDVKTVCYNFMPVLDWTRTDIDHRLPDGASALRFSVVALAAFDLYILERPGALEQFNEEQQVFAKAYLNKLTERERNTLVTNIMAGVPGTNDIMTIAEFKAKLATYDGVDVIALKQNLTWFLRTIVPEAEKLGIKICIHPDDPPLSILGLPRVVSTEADLLDVVNAYPSPNNGITFCTGSLGARADNDLPGIIERLGKHFHFLHLRNVQREADGSFYEADHLGGSNDMYAVMKNIILEQKRRDDAGDEHVAISMRPDHGHKLLDDFNYETFPGYHLIGRLKGLAELRGLELGIKRSIIMNKKP